MYAYIYPAFSPGGRYSRMSGPPEGPRGRGRHRHGFGPGGWGHGGGRGPRARRGDVRLALLVLLGEEPRNGYALMQEIELRSEGAWRPSPGSVYPTLQQLEDEGLITQAEREGRNVFELTEAGRRALADRGEDATAPWDAVKEEAGPAPRQVMRLIRDLASAAAQLVRAGDEAQVAQAAEVLRESKRSLYRILAEDAAGEPEERPAGEGEA